MTELTSSTPSYASLRALARNLWWCWDADATRLFESLAPEIWEECRHNPVDLLARIDRDELQVELPDELAERIAATERRLRRYVSTSATCDGSVPSPDHPVAYFCAEYGLHESLRLYSGGLGVLAGDHLKAASDLGLPMIAIGLYYRMGYLAQELDQAGTQSALERENIRDVLPLSPVLDADGAQVEVEVALPGRSLRLLAWTVAVGRVTLYLLDADTEANADEDRHITRRLYGGEHERRIQQEIVLGCGGVRLLARLGIEPSVWHMNEGHAAFLTLERTARLVADGATFDDARAVVRANTLFTTHTPVPAGHDRFAEDLMKTYFGDAPERLGLPWPQFIALGRSEEDADDFNMTVLALSFSSFCNGVSQLHGVASRKLLHSFWPDRDEADVPIATITNGIHLPTWTDPTIAEALGVNERPVRGDDFARGAPGVDRGKLWRRRLALKERLAVRVRRALRARAEARQDSGEMLDAMLAGAQSAALLDRLRAAIRDHTSARDLMFQRPGAPGTRSSPTMPSRPVRIW